MRVNSFLVKPPSLAAQLEGKTNKAFSEKIKETNQQKEQIAKENAEAAKSVNTQSLIDLLV